MSRTLDRCCTRRYDSVVSKRKSLKEALIMKQSVRFALTLFVCLVLSLSGVLVGVPGARATDRATWIQLPRCDNSPDAYSVGPLNCLAVTRTAVYVGSESRGVFRSVDSGATWNDGGGTWIDRGITWLVMNADGSFPDDNLPIVECLAVDPLSASTVYAGTAGDGVFRSTDSGTTWTALHKGLPSPPGSRAIVDIISLAVDPLIPTTLYACTAGGIFRSVDSGDGWTPLSPGAGFFGINPTTLSILYARTQTSVMRSTDSGTTWTTASTGLTGLLNWSITSLAINPLTPSTLYASTSINAAPPYGGGGVFRSTDSGVTWTAVNAGLTTIDGVECLAINPRTPTTLYAGTNGSGVFCSTDSGVAWTPMNTGLTNPNVSSLAIDPLTPNALYALAGDQDVCAYNATCARTLTTVASPSVGGFVNRPSDVCYSAGTVLSFTAVPYAGYVFAGWSGDLTGMDNPATITLDTDKIVTALFTPEAKKVIQLQIGSSAMLVDGRSLVLEAAPVILNSRTLLPIRAVVEAVGGSITWEASTQKVTIVRDDKTVELWIGRNIAGVSGRSVNVDSDPKVVPIIMSGRTLLPLRFVAEALALDVQWDAATKTITITYAP